MTERHKTYFNWSTGKDSAMALYHMMQSDDYQVDRLITTVNAHYNRVSMHGLRRALMEEQAKSLHLPLTTIELPEQPSMEEYTEKMEDAVKQLSNTGYTHTGFGDIFLEDLRAYREQQLNAFNITCCFPLWKRDTRALITEFVSLGFKAIVICVKSELLDASFVGRELDLDFIHDLPDTVDPCGENGEFHTFCYDGPIFNQPIAFTVGETVFKSYPNPDKKASNSSLGFWFCDLIPQTDHP